jgi:hypothetical protein
MDSDKGRSPPCGIYLHIRDVGDKLTTLKNLRAVAMVINRSTGYDKNMHMVMFDYAPLKVLELRELVEAVRMSGIVAISGGGVTGFESTGADGVLLDKIEDVAILRAQIGGDAIIGLDARKMDIKTLKDSGADFVILPADAGKIGAWSMISDVPCVAGGKIDNDTCGDYAQAGAGFVDVTDYVLKHQKGVLQGAVNVLHALELAADKKTDHLKN